ncbi:plexin-B2-like [Strongylocentrotus purpuratus]|uniref:Sema domain-containing protein n=1 Tax=Strongylocentrotus purpuratus TaxID=7668 RepID=A0A7M7PJE7_STRPU|nr:plexin-B2-like [Strongylocentrotus purpuratus]
MAGELKWRYCSSVLVIVMVLLVKCIYGSRDGQLSAYLREVFLDESGIALNQMVVSNESGTDYVYIGGVSTLYQLDLNLALLQQESTVPSDQTSCENTECLYETKILEVAPAPIGKLVQCGGPEGKCEIRNLMTIAREFGYVNISLVNEGMSVAVLEITESQPLEIFIYVATSIDSNNPGRVHSPITQFEVIQQLNILVPIRIENIREIAAIDSTVEYIQAIPWTIYNFFIVHSGSEHRRLGRLCSENLQDGLNAYSEIILSCQSYSILQSAYIDSNDVLYGVFTDGTHSALCSYAMTDIQERFVDTTCGCVISDDPSCSGTAISYLTTDAICSPSPNTNQSRESIEANYQCGDDEQMLLFSYAQATSSLEGNLLGEALPGEDSSIITLQKENTTVALVTTSSTSNTTLSKIHVFPDHTGRLYETVNLEVIGSVLTDVYINQETEELFTLTTKEVLKLAVVNCSQYKTFAGCIGLNHDGGDPFCGWCTLEQR